MNGVISGSAMYAIIGAAGLAALGAFLFFIFRRSAGLTGHIPSSSKLIKSFVAARKAYEEGRYGEAAGLYRPLVEAFRRSGNVSGLVSACTMAGICQEKLGEFQQAINDYNGAIATSYRQESEDSLFVAHRRAAYCHLILGNPQAAREGFTNLSQLYRELGMHRQSVGTLASMGNTFRGQGELDGAAEAYEEALQLSERLEFPDGRRLALHDKALFLRTMGELEQALRLLKEAIHLSANTSDSGGQSHMHVSYADTLRMLGRMNEAEGAQKQALAFAVVSATPRFLCLAQLCASQNGWHRGQREQAWELLKSSEDLLDKSSKDLQTVTALVKASYAEQSHDFDHALGIIGGLEQNGQELKHLLRAALLNIKVRALSKSGRAAEALTDLESSRKTSLLLKAPLYLAEYGLSAGVVSYHLGKYDDAVSHLGSALEFFGGAGWERETASLERYRALAFAAAGDRANAAISAEEAKKRFLHLGDVSSAENVTVI